MPNCSSISGTRSARNSSRAAAHEDAPAGQYMGLADTDLRRRAFDLAMGIRPARQPSLAGARSARSLFRVETVRDIPALPHPKLHQVQAGRIQWLVSRRVWQYN